MSRPSPVKAQRLRLRFARGPEAAAIGTLDLARVWERAFEAAGIAVSHSEGARPRPRLTIAAGLPSGTTSDGELLDVVLALRIPPAEAAQRLQSHLPPGLSVCEAWEVGLGLPALPSLVRWADYEVDVPVDPGGPDIAGAAASFLALDRFPWEDTRGEKTRHYDLRALVQDIEVRPCAPGTGGESLARLRMRLRCDAAGVGRPDQLALALGLGRPARVRRLRLVLAEVSPARDAWRRRGRFVE